MSKVQITITGSGHTKKTRMAVLIARELEKYGANVVLQRADPELNEKLQMTDDELGEKLDGIDVIIMEMVTN
jgi:hypothetical protein